MLLLLTSDGGRIIGETEFEAYFANTSDGVAFATGVLNRLLRDKTVIVWPVEEVIMDRGKTILFVDDSNVFQGSRNAGWRTDAKRLFAKLEEKGPIWQTFFFAAVTDPPR